MLAEGSCFLIEYLWARFDVRVCVCVWVGGYVCVEYAVGAGIIRPEEDER
jgi:hypothetical protein